MITVGENSYITAAEADEYIRSHYTSSSPEFKRWYKTLTNDRRVYLICAYDEIAGLPFTRPVDGIPEALKAAQCELALWLSDTDKRGGEDSRRELIRQGVTSYSLGDLSETYGGVSGGGSVSDALACDKCARLLRPWLNGGYAIC